MYRSSALLLGAALLLAACGSLTAQLLQGSSEHVYSVTYAHDGQEHTMIVKITVKEQQVIALAIEPGAASGLERAHQLAFSANVRLFLIAILIKNIKLPESVGEESWITAAFDKQVLEKLKKDV